MESKIKLFDESRHDLLDSLADGDGLLFDFDLEDDQVEYFRGVGLFFSGLYKDQKVLFMPREISVAFKQMEEHSLHALVARNTEHIHLTHGLLFYYGLLEFDQLTDMVSNYSGKQVENSHCLSLLLDASSYYQEFHRNADDFIHYRVGDSDWLKMEQESRSNLDFYPFPKDQLLQASIPEFVDRNPFYQSFQEFIEKKCGIHEEEADVLVRDVMEGILTETN